MKKILSILFSMLLVAPLGIYGNVTEEALRPYDRVAEITGVCTGLISSLLITQGLATILPFCQKWQGSGGNILTKACYGAAFLVGFGSHFARKSMAEGVLGAIIPEDKKKYMSTISAASVWPHMVSSLLVGVSSFGLMGHSNAESIWVTGMLANGAGFAATR